MFQFEIGASSLHVSGVWDEWGMIIRCEGQLNVRNLAVLQTMFVAARKLKSREIELDLREVLLVNGSLLWLLLREQPRLEQAEQELRVLVSPEQLDQFRMAGADRVLNLVCDDRFDGINHQ
jgi:anti-anti-sigma regulatory factor